MRQRLRSFLIWCKCSRESYNINAVTIQHPSSQGYSTAYTEPPPSFTVDLSQPSGHYTSDAPAYIPSHPKAPLEELQAVMAERLFYPKYKHDGL